MNRAARSAATALLLPALLWVGSCGTTPPSRFYVLQPLASPGTDGPAELAPLHLETVELPKYLSGPEIVSRRAENELEMAELERWAEPLRDAVARVLVRDLGAFRGGGAVTRFAWERPTDPHALFLSVAIERFEAEPQGAERRVVLVARWSLSGGRSAARAGEWSRPVAGGGHGAVVHAMSEVLADLARAICAEQP